MVISGAVLVLMGSSAFSSPDAVRTAHVQVADSPDAYIGLEKIDQEVTKSGSTDVIRIYNNIDRAVEIQTNLQTSSKLQAADDADGSSIDPGAKSQASVECDGGGTGQEQVTLEVVNAVTSDNSFSVSDASITNTVVYDCTGGSTGDVNFSASDVDANEKIQVFSFAPTGGLSNKQTATIDLSDPQNNGGVDYTGLTATVTTGKGVVTYDSSLNQLNYTAQGNEANIKIEVSGLSVNSDQGGVVKYEDTEGRLANDDFDVFGIIVEIGDSTGDIDVSGDVLVKDDATTDGEVQSDGDVIYGNDTISKGDIDAGGSLEIGSNSEAKGNIDVGGSFTVEDNSVFGGEIVAGGGITMGDNALVKDDVTTGGDLELGDGAEVKGNIDVGGSLIVGDNADLGGRVEVGGDMEIGSGSTVGGEVVVGQDLYIGDDSTFKNDVSVNGTAYVGCNVEFKGTAPSNTVDDCN